MKCGSMDGSGKWLAFGLLAGIGIATLLVWQKRERRMGDNDVSEADVDTALEMTFPASDPPAY